MRTHTYILVLFTIFTLALIGCSSPNSSNPTATQAFTPNSIWVYSNDSLDVSGTVISTRKDTVSIISSSFIDDTKQEQFSDNSTATLLPFGSGYSLSTLNVVTSICGAGFPIPANFIDTISTLTVPVKIGNTTAQGQIAVFVKNLDLSITVPAGTFTCDEFALSISTQNIASNEWQHWYVSPTVGIVQAEYYQINPQTGAMYLAQVRKLVATK